MEVVLLASNIIYIICMIAIALSALIMASVDIVEFSRNNKKERD